MSIIGLIDYGAGNFTSVRNALDYLGLTVLTVREPPALRDATHVVLPGVGAFAGAMRRLESLKFVEPLREEVVERRKPFLGICVGMQVLATLGKEFEDYKGLGWIDGTTAKIDVQQSKLRLPHIGWNNLQVLRDSPLLAGMGSSPTFYFVHSYHLVPGDPAVVLATCRYGIDVVSIVGKKNVFGVQFHPEKSQHDGLRLLRNFSALSC